MPGVSAEQVKLAREVDLLSYLQANEPGELRKSGPNEYRTATHGSLVISNGLWIWNRGQVAGKSAIDYLIKIRGMGFVDAVETVLGSRASPSFSFLPAEKAKQPRPDFKLPEAAPFPSNVVSYLQWRGISPEVIRRCLDAGILYESRKYRNAVFVGKDEDGVARFACLRGIKGGFRADAPGSDKRYSFSLPAEKPGSRHLAVFESPMDLLSHVSLQQRGGWEWDGHRLSLGGTSLIALTAFLERNTQIIRVMLHLDNDAAGLTAAKSIKGKLAADNRFKQIKVSVNPARGAKDYNDILLHVIDQEKEQKQQRRKVSISL